MTFVATSRTSGPFSTTSVHRTVLRDDGALGSVLGVEVLRWPEEEARRADLLRAGQPCLLVVRLDEPAPRTSELEDWVREPIDSEELVSRARSVRARAECGAPPVVDDGLLVNRGAWMAIPPGQVEMVSLLVDRFGAVVRKEELVAAAGSSGASSHGEAVKAAMVRLARRVAPLGLELCTIRGRGYLLQLAGPCPVHGTRGAPKTKGSCS